MISFILSKTCYLDVIWVDFIIEACQQGRVEKKLYVNGMFITHMTKPQSTNYLVFRLEKPTFSHTFYL